NYPDVLDKYLQLFYLPKDGDKFITQLLEIPRETSEVRTYFTYNPFAENLNIFINNSWKGNVKTGLTYKYGLGSTDALVIARSDFSSIIGSSIKFQKANDYLQAHTTPKRIFNGTGLYTHTNKFGLTTVIAIEQNVD